MQVLHREVRFQTRDKDRNLTYGDAKFEITIDDGEIARLLGGKALQNKSRKSKLAVGVKVEVIRGLPEGHTLIHSY